MAVSFGIEFPDGVVDGLIEVFRSGEDPMGAIGSTPLSGRVRG
jgi:hypothetical protein